MDPTGTPEPRKAPEHKQGLLRACFWKVGPRENTARGPGQGVQKQGAVRTVSTTAGPGTESVEALSGDKQVGGPRNLGSTPEPAGLEEGSLSPNSRCYLTRHYLASSTGLGGCHHDQPLAERTAEVW